MANFERSGGTPKGADLAWALGIVAAFALLVPPPEVIIQ